MFPSAISQTTRSRSSWCGMLSKNPFQVRIHHHPIPVLVQLHELRHGRVATAMPPKAMRAVMERRFKDRFQQGTDRLLCHATPDGGNPQGPGSPFALGDIHPPQRDWLVVPNFSSRISAKRFSSRLASNILIDCLSSPAAPRLRFTALKALRSVSRVILPVSECTRSVRGRTVSIQVILREHTNRGSGAILPLSLFLALTWPSRKRRRGPCAVATRGLTGPLPGGSSIPLS